MNTATIISIASLIVAILSIPISYWNAKRQVKFELAENERQKTERAKFIVINNLDEFFKIFYAAVKEIVKIDQTQLNQRMNEIDPYIYEIDVFIGKTRIFERLNESIGDLMRTSFFETVKDEEMEKRLLSIRNQIYLGSDKTRSVSLAIIYLCNGDSLLNALRNS